jgi:hypothetical protein
MRDGIFSNIHYSSRLFQEFLVDAYAQIENNRLQYHRLNQQNLRAELYDGLQDAVLDGTDLTDIGQRVILPSSFVGSPRYMTQLYQDAMAIVGATSNPDLFITFTANPQWSEVMEAILPTQTAQDRPDIIARVFKLKLNALCSDLFDKHVLGRVRARMHVVEFQKRGLPHAHILIILHPEDKPKTVEDIDSIVSAEIPNPVDQPHLYSIVTKCMLHGPCGSMKPNASCMKNGKCSKHYPRPFATTTTIDDNSYPVYKRRDNQHAVVKEGLQLDNRWIVP